MISSHGTIIQGGINAKLLTTATAMILQPTPVSLFNVKIGCRLGTHLETGIRIKFARRKLRLTMLGMEELDVTSTRGEYEWILLIKLGGAIGRIGRFRPIRQGIIAPRG